MCRWTGARNYFVQSGRRLLTPFASPIHGRRCPARLRKDGKGGRRQVTHLLTQDSDFRHTKPNKRAGMEIDSKRRRRRRRRRRKKRGNRRTFLAPGAKRGRLCEVYKYPTGYLARGPQKLAEGRRQKKRGESHFVPPSFLPTFAACEMF